EGATTAALCAAISAVQQGRRVIAIDGDVRRRSLSRRLGSTAVNGLLEVCAQPANWRRFVEEEAETGLHFIAAAPSTNSWRTLTGSQGFAELIATLRQSYDLVVLDCPPALSVADGAFIAGRAERCVLVAGWDRTPMGALRATLKRVRRHSHAATSV